MTNQNFVQKVLKLSDRTFRINWHQGQNLVPDSTIKLNFQPLIEAFELKGQFVLVHWQAKPKGLRRWGVYCSALDNYFATDCDRLDFCDGLAVRAIQIDERVVKTLPTAVLYFADAIAMLDDDGVHIRRAV